MDGNQEIVTKGIVLRTTNYQENDKLLTIFSVDYGKITAHLRGCRKPNAKLKFAGQPFCFSEFVLVQKGENFIVTNVSEIESFFEISQNYEILKKASALLEMSESVLNAGEPNSALFVALLKSLQQASFGRVNIDCVLAKFNMQMLAMAGYELNFNQCSQCGGAFNTHIVFDYDLGNFVCGLCRGQNAVEISKSTFALLKLINQTDWQRLGTIKINKTAEMELLEIFKTNYENRFGKKLKSLN